MTDIGYVVICKLCKQPVNPNELEVHLLAHQPSAYFDTIPVIQKWDKKDKKRGKK